MHDFKSTFRWAAHHKTGRRKIRGAVAGVAAAGLVIGTALSGTSAFAGPARGAGLATKAVNARAVLHAARQGSPGLGPRHGRFLGILPSGSGRFARSAASANGTPPLLYHNGPVQHSSKVYAIFWQPAGHYLPPSYRATVAQYFTDVSKTSFKTSNVYAAATQYYDNTGPGGSKNWVSYNVSYGGSATVTSAVPASGCSNYTLGDFSTTWACLTDAQLQSKISSVVSAQGWPTGLGSEYFLFTPPGLGSCFDTNPADGCYDPASSSGYCAYHSNISGSTLYANQPWADISGCQYSVPDSPYPNDDGADTVINVVSHEQNETMTDPLGNAWFDSSGYENGDECAWLSLPTHYNGIGDYSQTINKDQYLMQFEWSNRAGTCVGTSTYPQPAGSFSAAPAGTHAEAFTATASDSDDTAFTYGWDFGDGTTTLTTSTTVSHLYTAGGNYTVTLIVFDSHGDQVQVKKSVSVS